MVQLFLKTYRIIEDAVESGVAYGIRRAYKHTDNPSETALQENIEHAVMNALSEVIDFERYEFIKPEDEASSKE
jgi:hypothetical protein